MSRAEKLLDFPIERTGCDMRANFGFRVLCASLLCAVLSAANGQTADAPQTPPDAVKYIQSKLYPKAMDPQCAYTAGCDDQNGIVIDEPKVYDNRTLQLQLNLISSRLAQVSGIDQTGASLLSRIGGTQGASSAQTALSLQALASPTPSTQTTAITSSPSNQQTNYSGAPPTSPTTYANQSVTNQPSNTLQTLTNTAAMTPAVPSLPTSSGFTAPTGFNISAIDALNEEMQLSYQLTSLQLLLQGSLNDDYSLTGRPKHHVTLGFPISISTPERYRNAVAEVEVSVCNPAEREDGTSPSLQAILPEQKTYNVAALSNHSVGLGAGAVIASVVNVTGNFLWSHQTYYLMKDVDTVALYRTQGSSQIDCPAYVPPPFDKAPSAFDKVPPALDKAVLSTGPVPKQRRALEQIALEAAVKSASLDTSTASQHVPPGSQHVTLAWQFRPVLGRAAVDPGLRPTFAQISFAPTWLSGDHDPNTEDLRAAQVVIHACWRSYDAKRGIVGETIRGSCSKETIHNVPIVFDTTAIDHITATDNGDGSLNVKVFGAFPSGTQVALGDSYIPIVDQVTGRDDQADSSYLRFTVQGQTAATHELRIVSPDGAQQDVTATQAWSCDRPQNGSAEVLPFSASLARVRLLSPPACMSSKGAGSSFPTVVILGGKVFGLSDAPFSHYSNEYIEFIAPISLIQGQSRVLLKRIFAPDDRHVIYEITPPNTSIAGISLASTGKNASSTYIINGTGLDQITIAYPRHLCDSRTTPCITAYGSTVAVFTLGADNTKQVVFVSKTKKDGTAIVEPLPKPDNGGGIGDDTSKVSFQPVNVPLSSTATIMLTGSNLQLVSEIDYLGKSVPFSYSGGTGAKTLALAPPTGLTSTAGTVNLKIVLEDGSSETLAVTVGS